MSEKVVDPLRPEMVSKATFLYVSNIATAVLGAIAILFSYKFVGTEAYGTVAFALSFAGMFIFIADFGLSISHTKKISGGADLKSCLSVYVSRRVMLAALYGLAVVLIVVFWRDIMGQGFENPDAPLAIIVILLYYIQNTLTSIFTSTFLAQRNVFHAQAIVLIDLFTRTFAIMAVVILQLGMIGLAVAYAVEGTVTLIIAVAFAKRLLPPFKFSFRLDEAEKGIWREYVEMARPILIATVLGTIILYLDKVFIQFFFTATETAVYYASQRILMLYVAMGPAILSIAFPVISHLHGKEGGAEQIGKITGELMRYLLMVIVPVSAFLFFFSKDVLMIYPGGPSASSGYLAFSLLTLAYSLNILAVPFSSQILGMGRTKSYAVINIASSLIVIVLDAILIPTAVLGWGMEGAAVAFLAGQIAVMSLLCISAVRKIKVKVPIPTLGIFLATGIATAVTYWFSTLLPISRFYDLILVFLVYLAIIVPLAIALRVISRAEIRELLGMVKWRHLIGEKDG